MKSDTKSKVKKVVRKILWGCGIVLVILLLIAIFAPEPTERYPSDPSSSDDTSPSYSITQSDQWEKEATFKVKVDSLLSEKDVLEIANKIKKDSVAEDKRVTVWFYIGMDFSGGATQTVRFTKDSPVPDYSVTSISNEQMREAKNLRLDSLSDSEIIASDLIPNFGLKEIIYKLKNGKYAQTTISRDGTHSPFVYLEPDPGNGSGIYNFKITSGPDEGMRIKIDQFQKYIEYSEVGGDLVFRRNLID